MKRFLMLVGVAVVAAAMYVAASPASQQAKAPTAKQFNALKKQVAGLGKTVKGLKKVVAADSQLLTDCVKVAIPINQFGNPQPQTGEVAEGYDYRKGATIGTPTSEFYTTGLDVSATTDTNAVWFVGGQAQCGTDLGETALQHAAAKAGIRLSHASMRAPSFTAHRP
jgi:opacity protein-like surface antigen